MKTAFFLVVVSLAVAGCDTRPIESLGYEERMQLAQKIDERCTKLGINPKSAQMEDCRMAEIEKEVSTREARRQGSEALAVGLQSYGNSMSAQAESYRSRQVNCTSNRMGNSVYTNCY